MITKHAPAGGSGGPFPKGTYEGSTPSGSANCFVMRLVSQFLCLRNETSSILVRSATGCRPWRPRRLQTFRTAFDSPAPCRAEAVGETRNRSVNMGVSVGTGPCFASRRMGVRPSTPPRNAGQSSEATVIGIDCERVRLPRSASAVPKASLRRRRVGTAKRVQVVKVHAGFPNPAESDRSRLDALRGQGRLVRRKSAKFSQEGSIPSARSSLKTTRSTGPC